jgi:hypothetical protein
LNKKVKCHVLLNSCRYSCRKIEINEVKYKQMFF